MAESRILTFGDDSVLFDGRFIQVVKRPFTNTVTGKPGHWEMVQRKVLGRIVAVVGLTADRKVVLVKIFRVPLGGYIVEPCAGLADNGVEDEKVLARRELLEETGYECGDLTLLMAGPFDAGLNAEEIAIYLGTDARKVSEPKLETAEDIEVILVPVDELASFLANPPSGMCVDVKLWGLLPFLKP